ELARTMVLFALPERLPSAEHGIFQRLSRRKTQSSPCWNLDLLAGCRVPSDTSLQLALTEHTETGQPKRAFLLELPSYQLVEFVEGRLGLPLGDPDLVGQVSGHLRLRHPPPPKTTVNIEQDE